MHFKWFINYLICPQIIQIWWQCNTLFECARFSDHIVIQVSHVKWSHLITEGGVSGGLKWCDHKILEQPLTRNIVLSCQGKREIRAMPPFDNKEVEEIMDQSLPLNNSANHNSSFNYFVKMNCWTLLGYAISWFTEILILRSVYWNNILISEVSPQYYWLIEVISSTKQQTLEFSRNK